MLKKGTGSTTSVLLTSRSSAAGLTVSTADLLLLPLLPPAGFSTLVVVTLAVLATLRTPLPGWKFGRTTTVMAWVSPLARLPMVQLKAGAAGVSWAPAAIEQVEPAAVEAIDTTVKPLSPPGKLKLSLTTTPVAVDGPLLRNEST